METVELNYEYFGEANNACPIIILHGFFASSRNWRTIAKQLASKQPVYVLDLRNHGASPHHQLMDYPALAADVLAFMDSFQLTKAHFIGHSMGGKVAMYLALLYPVRVDKLIVVDIAPVSYQHNFDALINALKGLPLADLQNRKQADDHLAPVITDANNRQFLLQNLMFANNHFNWRINLDYFHINADYIVSFPALINVNAYQTSALFLAGESSAYVIRESVYHWFPLATIIEIPGTGHWLQVDAPQAFLAQVDAWLLM